MGWHKITVALKIFSLGENFQAVLVLRCICVEVEKEREPLMQQQNNSEADKPMPALPETFHQKKTRPPHMHQK